MTRLLHLTRVAPLAVGLLALAPARLAAADPPPPPEAESSAFFSRIRGLFDVDLPQLDAPGTIKLTFRPHVADFIKRDYLRVATGLRWAATEDLELNAEGEVFATHGFGDTDDGYGVGEVRFGGRYIKRQWPRPDYESAFGLEVQIPTGSPPYDLTDGHNHFTPSFVTQHHWATNRRVTAFGSAALDIVTPSSVHGDFGRNTPRDDSVSLTGGFVYDLGQVKWTLQATYANTWISGRDEHFFTLRPSVVWLVPRRYTFHMKTQWIVGLGLRSTWGPDGHDFGTSTRVRAEVTFRQMMANFRQREASRPEPAR